MIPSLFVWLRILALASLTASATQAQISLAYGPTRAPLACPVRYTVSNDTPVAIDWDPCGFRVYDAQGALVYQLAPCAPVTLQPGEVHVATWPQVDLAGNPVAPGAYFLGAPGGPRVTVGGVQTAIGPLGTLRHGRTRGLQLCSPQDAGRRYVLLASTSTTTGFATCGGTVPLDPGRILLASASNPVVFRRFAGRFDANGLSVAPALAVPDDPRLAGTVVHFTFLVLDPQAPCRVRRISEPASLTIF